MDKCNSIEENSLHEGGFVCGEYKDTFSPPGLGNPGQLCYFNSLLQALASSRHWREFFSKSTKDFPMMFELGKLILKLSKPHCKGSILPTKECRRAIEDSGISVDIIKQQDYLEFYQTLLEAIERQLISSASSKLNAAVVRRIFPTNFIYTETIRCKRCSFKSQQINFGKYITIPVKFRTLKDGLREFFSEETLNSSCEKCESQGRVASTSIDVHPRTLLFFIGRRNGYSTTPSHDPFEFPKSISLLNYRPKKTQESMLRGSITGVAESSDITGDEFKLTAVVVFQGSDNRGHYFTYRLHGEESGLNVKRWFRCNDSTVTSVTEKEVLDCKDSCLLLQYEMCE